MFRASFHSIWSRYQHYVESCMQSPVNHPVQNIGYWRKRLFTNAILYALPISILALIPSMFLEYRAGNTFIAIFNVFALVAVAIIALKREIPLRIRKMLIAATIAFFSIMLTAFLGGFSMGCIYLFSLSVFIALQFSDKFAYGAVVFNFVFCLCFSLIIRYKWFEIPLIYTTPFDRWIIYSVNFLFMDLVVVALIRETLNGFENAMEKKAWLFNELQNELAQKANINNYLKNSEEHYKTLFFQSPSPKLIFDIDTLLFLQVNRAAIRNYGYTEQEFLTMKLTDIHPEECLAELHDHIKSSEKTDVLTSYATQHVAKDGKRIHTEVSRSNITFKGKAARMIIATDITQLVNYTAAIKKQNEKLYEIAYIQSHVIRLPLARIMSLSELISQEYGGKIDQKLLDYLDTSAKELDTVIREIVNKSDEILSEQPHEL